MLVCRSCGVAQVVGIIVAAITLDVTDGREALASCFEFAPGDGGFVDESFRLSLHE